jgi:hypothetical protein
MAQKVTKMIVKMISREMAKVKARKKTFMRISNLIPKKIKIMQMGQGKPDKLGLIHKGNTKLSNNITKILLIRTLEVQLKAHVPGIKTKYHRRFKLHRPLKFINFQGLKLRCHNSR